MRPLTLRDEMPPDDTVVVVRGGTMNSEFVRSSATDAFDDFRRENVLDRRTDLALREGAAVHGRTDPRSWICPPAHAREDR